jgi:hypothetical protein
VPDYTTTGLIEQVKRRISIPPSQNLITTARFISILNDELQTRIVPFLMSMREEWFVTYVDYSTDGTTSEYDIPSDAVGQKLRDVQLWQNGKQYKNVPRLAPEQLVDSYFGFYVQNNKIIIYPDALASGYTLRISYFKRTNDLVSTNDAGYISTASSNQITLSTTPPATFINGAEIDIISKNSPFITKETLTISNVVGSTITFTSNTTAVTGDYACISGESVYPNIPIECIAMLCQSAGIRVLEALGDTEGLQIAMANYAQIEQSAKSTLSPKVDGEVKRVINRRRLMRYIL